VTFGLRVRLRDAFAEWRYLREQPPPHGIRGERISAALVYGYAQRLLLREHLRRHAVVLGRGIVAHGTERAPGHAVRVMPRGPVIENHGGQLEIGAGSIFVHQDMVPVRVRLAPGASVRLGQRVAMNYGASITAYGTIEIGDDVLIGPYAEISDAPADPGRGSSIHIEAGVWLGARARVVAGTRIGRGAVIGAGTTAQGLIPARSMVIGDPPQLLSPRARRERDADIAAAQRR